MVAAGIAYTSQEELGLGSGLRPRQISTDCLVLKNESGGALVRGSVLEIGAKLITTPTPEALWFSGSTPSPDGTKGIAVLKYPAPSNGLVECQSSGVVLCRLNVNQVQQTRADVDGASTLLQSKWHGRCEILWKSTASTGEQDALVRVGEMFRGPIKGVAASGLTRGSSATVTVYWANAAASPSSTVTVHWNWMDGGSTDVPSSGELFFGWHPDEQKYLLWNAECDH